MSLDVVLVDSRTLSKLLLLRPVPEADRLTAAL